MELAWEREFQRQIESLDGSGDDRIRLFRKGKIVGFFREITASMRITQGISQQIRELVLWDKSGRPTPDQKLNVWIRDGWNENEQAVAEEIRAAGSDCPLAYVYVRKSHDTELRAQIVHFLAAGITLDKMGLTFGFEAEQAKEAIETRKLRAKEAIDDLINRICGESAVFLAGGSVPRLRTLKDNLEAALQQVANRQFPVFAEKGDFLNWDQALKHALNAQTDALECTGYSGQVFAHPAAVEILHFLGQETRRGREIRSTFMKSPFGWSQDAVDTLLILLTHAQRLTCNQAFLYVSEIDDAEFKCESIVLSEPDKLTLKTLFRRAGINCPSHEFLFPHSNAYLEQLKNLSYRVSGDAPKPEPIHLDFILEIERKPGNERLHEILKRQSMLQSCYDEWTTMESLMVNRLPLWNLLIDLAGHAPDSPDFIPLKKEIRTIEVQRKLLHDPDLIQPALLVMAEKLQSRLNRVKEKYIRLHEENMIALQNDEHFGQLRPEQKRQILLDNHLMVKPEIKSLDARGLLFVLQKTSIEDWNNILKHLPGQFKSAKEQARELRSPQVLEYCIPKVTLSNRQELDNYIFELKSTLEVLFQTSDSIRLK